MELTDPLEATVWPGSTTSYCYHVAISGDNSGDGSEDSPWLTLQHAAGRVSAGDEVVVHPGNYAGFDLRRDGTAAAPIRFSAEPGVVIDSENPRTPDGINLEGGGPRRHRRVRGDRRGARWDSLGSEPMAW